MTVSLRLQVEAVELAALNQRGHANNIELLVGKGKRGQTELDIARMSLPALDAAAKTLAFIERHEAAFRKLIEAQGEGGRA